RPVIADRQRVAILPVAEPELALVVGAPKPIGLVRAVQLGSLRLVTAAFATPYQAIAIEHGVDRADRRRLDHGILPQQLVPDLRRTPGRVLALDPENAAFDLKMKLVGLPIRPTAALMQCIETAILVVTEDLVAGNP